jgi:hypothetical protein
MISLPTSPQSDKMRKASMLGASRLFYPLRLIGVVMVEYILVHGISVAKSFEPETFGRLTTIGPKFLVGKNRTAYQVCECSCGAIVTTGVSSLKRGRSKSCGCLQKEIAKKQAIELGKASVKHNLSRSSEYVVYYDILKRCQNPACKNYRDYGGRGIKVCDRWLGASGFVNFFKDMEPRPSPKHSLDRIDNDGDYCPENCRWATNTQQSNNRRSNTLLVAFGETGTISQFARKYGIRPDTLRRRLFALKWPIEKALTTPTKR